MFLSLSLWSAELGLIDSRSSSGRGALRGWLGKNSLERSVGEPRNTTMRSRSLNLEFSLAAP